jgi:hypothetical protein
MRSGTQQFTIALLMIVKRSKQGKHPSTNEQISKMQQIHTTEYYLVKKKKNEALLTLMNLENTMAKHDARREKTTPYLNDSMDINYPE